MLGVAKVADLDNALHPRFAIEQHVIQLDVAVQDTCKKRPSVFAVHDTRQQVPLVIRVALASELQQLQGGSKRQR